VLQLIRQFSENKSPQSKRSAIMSTLYMDSNWSRCLWIEFLGIPADDWDKRIYYADNAPKQSVVKTTLSIRMRLCGIERRSRNTLWSIRKYSDKFRADHVLDDI
jgi:hypothetical protein